MTVQGRRLLVSAMVLLGCSTITQCLPSVSATGTSSALRAYPATLTVSEGQRAVFYCDDGAAQKSIKWTKSGEGLREGLGKTENGRLALLNLTTSDSGVYVCSVDGGGASLQPANVQLNVIKKEPTGSRNETTVEIQIVRKTATEQETVSLQCDVDFANPSDVVWAKIGADLPTHAATENGKLTFTSIRKEDAGYYECRDRNDAKTDMVQNLVQLVVRKGN
ncbi:basement membrane-specific heparan sulfate proteoglycan core protein-like [Paramacrobiotus metropolitanus]|uniref:basement membrane-specific heparan sulfate proteoglycan core protein-like n=1 Tax=Paramacrobiotus metropolitanus TaxID=2943436 RepID=UPI00244599F4|nr:basement membrane-specific heparan sulfate proteoglycan core protein-like [Paramacrobiotus metropolitanus]